MLQLITTERNIRTLIVQNTIKKDIFSSYSSSFPTKSVCTLSLIFGLLLVLIKKVILSQKWINGTLACACNYYFHFFSNKCEKDWCSLCSQIKYATLSGPHIPTTLLTQWQKQENFWKQWHTCQYHQKYQCHKHYGHHWKHSFQNFYQVYLELWYHFHQRQSYQVHYHCLNNLVKFINASKIWKGWPSWQTSLLTLIPMK